MNNLDLRKDRYNKLAERNRRLFLCLVLSLVACGLSAGMNIHLMDGYEIRTGYFVLGEDGSLTALGESQRISNRDHRVIRSFLETFVMEAFRVSIDRGVVSDAQAVTMRRTCKNARARMNDFFNKERNPYSGLHGGRSVEVERPTLRILPVGEDGITWQISVREVHRDKGSVVGEVDVEMTVTLDFEGDEVSRQEGTNTFGIWVSFMHLERFMVQEKRGS